MLDKAHPTINAVAIRFRGRFLLAVLIGMPGVLSLLLVLPAIPGVSAAALLVNPVILLTVMSAVGAACAPRAGLKSRLLLGGSLTSSDLAVLARMAGLGMLLGIGIALLDQVLARGWQAASAVPSLADGWSWAQLLAGMLYGGITEEVVMRWGLLSGVLWALLRLFGKTGRSWRIAAGIALIVSAAVFAAGHLPALLAAGDLPPLLLARTLGLNFALGIAFGLAFLRHHLEAAIVLHATFHIGVALAALSLS